MRVLKRWARVSGEPPPTTPALEHSETKVQSSAGSYAATGMWAQKEAAVGQASARGRAMFVVPGSNVKHNDFFNVNNVPNV